MITVKGMLRDCAEDLKTIFPTPSGPIAFPVFSRLFSELYILKTASSDVTISCRCSLPNWGSKESIVGSRSKSSVDCAAKYSLKALALSISCSINIF